MRGAARRLNLTDAQREQIKTIAQSHRDEWRGLADRMRTSRQALVDATAANPIDEGAIRQRSADIAAVQADVAVARAKARAEMMQVLTPDQQAQLDTMRSRMRDRLAARRQR
jgi:protein CpxP